MIFNDMTCDDMLKHVETCWNCLHRSQDSAPRADHRARPHPRLRSAPEFHKRRKQSKDLSQCQHVSAMSRSFFCFVLSSSPCYRVAAMSAERMCQTMGVVQKTQKDLQHAHFKNIIEYIKCGFQHISTNQTRSAPSRGAFCWPHFLSRDPTACGPPALQGSLGTSCPVISSKVGAFRIQLFAEFDDITYINIANIAWCS